MHKILSILAHEKQLDSLRNIQSTSSAVYTIATPYLYRDLHFGIGLKGFGKLLRLFNDVSPSPHLLIQDLASDAVHPLDLDLYGRLCWALAFTKSINLVLRYGTFEVPPSDTRMYLDICGGLRVLGLPTIWSALDNVSVLLDGSDQEQDNFSYVRHYVLFPFGCTLLDLLDQTGRLSRLTVDLPHPPGNYLDTEDAYVWAYHETRSTLWNMAADHVTVLNLSEHTQGVPSAALSLTIGFALYAGLMDHASTPRSGYEWLRARSKLLEATASVHPCSLMRITVIGFEGEVENVTAENVYDVLVKAFRLYEGAVNKDFRFRIKPRGSGETGKWDVWHKLDEPFGDHFHILKEE